MQKKVSWDDFQKGKEYKMWGHLFDMLRQWISLVSISLKTKKQVVVYGFDP